jgi:plasmid stabilization system protein ParE
MEICRRFLHESAPLAARRAMLAIRTQLQILRDSPDIGRPVPEADDMRELIIDFGDSGYLALYRYVAHTDTVYILAFRHQKEAGY